MTGAKRHKFALVLTIGLAGVIAYFTLSPMQADAPFDFLSDKASHAIAFAALVFPCALLFQRSLIWLVPAALVFGAGIEFIQPSVGRSGEFADFLADIAGVAIGLIAGRVMRRWFAISRAAQTPR